MTVHVVQVSAAAIGEIIYGDQKVLFRIGVPYSRSVNLLQHNLLPSTNDSLQ